MHTLRTEFAPPNCELPAVTLSKLHPPLCAPLMNMKFILHVPHSSEGPPTPPRTPPPRPFPFPPRHLEGWMSARAWSSDSEVRMSSIAAACHTAAAAALGFIARSSVRKEQTAGRSRFSLWAYISGVDADDAAVALLLLLLGVRVRSFLISLTSAWTRAAKSQGW